MQVTSQQYPILNSINIWNQRWWQIQWRTVLGNFIDVLEKDVIEETYRLTKTYLITLAVWNQVCCMTKGRRNTSDNAASISVNNSLSETILTCCAISTGDSIIQCLVVHKVTISWKIQMWARWAITSEIYLKEYNRGLRHLPTGCHHS